jgi:hypothetical protein
MRLRNRDCTPRAFVIVVAAMITCVAILAYLLR